jgi:hypothetical protein
MRIDFKDFNGAAALLTGKWAKEWSEIEGSILNVPMHFKASDQAGKIGSAIFNPVATNKWLEDDLQRQGWANKVSIPDQYKCFGKDVDFGKGGVLVEVQFSNYPFLLNNLLRSQIFHRKAVALTGQPPEVVVIITKTGKFPASNSTLYYEQGLEQLTVLESNQMFDVPIRLVGLFANTGPSVDGVWNSYHARRYSRTVANTNTVKFNIVDGTPYKITKL